MSIGEEREIGEKLLYTIRKDFHLMDDPDIVQYVYKLGNEVLSAAGPQYFDYKFFIVQNKEFNAFAAPAGLIFFFSGLIEKMDTENELISVLAHEVGHVESRHIAGRLKKDKTISAVTTTLALASLALGNPALAQGLFTGSLAAGQTLSLSYSRHDEEEADRLAFGWMQSRSRNPEAMLGMLKAMRRITRYRSEQIPAYLLTHPNPEMRLDYVASLLDVEQDAHDFVQYNIQDNFSFLRMKYRIMVQVHEGVGMKAYFENKLDRKGDLFQVGMAKYGLALLAAQELDYQKGLRLLQEVRQLFPGKDILNVDEGIIYLESGRYNLAYELLNGAVLLNPSDMYATYNLARVLEKRGQGRQARNFYLKVEKAMPDYSHIYYALGRLESEQGRFFYSEYYLGKHYLFEGRLKLAQQKLLKVKNNAASSENLKRDAGILLKQIKKIEN